MNLHLNCLDLLEPDENYTPQHLHVTGKRYEGEMIVIDNHLYERCSFVDCNFVYAGGPFGFQDCEIDGGFLSPTGAARRFSEIQKFFQENVRNTRVPPY